MDDPPNTVTRVREPRKSARPARDRDRDDDDGVRSVKGSTRLEAKKQRRREGREAGGPVPVAPIRTRLRGPVIDGHLVGAPSPVPMRRPMGLFEVSVEAVRESYVPLRRAG